MPGWLIALIALGVFGLLVLIQVVCKVKRPVQRAIGGIAVGFCALLAVNITGLFTGVSLPFSPLTIGVSGAAGIPGVTLMLLLNLIWK